MPSPDPCQFTITIKGDIKNDDDMQCLYSTSNAVSLLPIRRIISHDGILKELIITLNKLRPLPDSALFRVKGLTLDFRTDLVAEYNTVPGMKVVGTIVLNSEFKSNYSTMKRGQRVFLFPFSSCLIQSPTNVCNNCRHLSSVEKELWNDPITTYELYRKYSCMKMWVYGKTIDGGLQDFIRVPAPLKLLIVVPKLISLHDCCLLLEVAVPFLAYCKDFLCKLSPPFGNVMVILNDFKSEINDCLLVLRHLVLNEKFFTFTDISILTTTTLSRQSYQNQFRHVLLFDTSQQALDVSISLKNFSFEPISFSITIFQKIDQMLPKIPPRTNISYIKLTYKDIYLMRSLLETLEDMNGQVSDAFTEPFSWSPDLTTITSFQGWDEKNTSKSHEYTIPPASPEEYRGDGDFEIGQPNNSEDRENIRGENNKMRPRWLKSDYTFHLRPNDSCEHEEDCRCVLADIINQLKSRSFLAQRVHLKNHPAKKTILNAFVFS